MKKHETTTMTTPSTGFALGRSRIHTTTQPNKARAIFRARKALEEVVYDTVALEGNPFTFPEVKTLMDGITVGGRRVEDDEQVLNQARSWRELIARVEAGTSESTGQASRSCTLTSPGKRPSSGACCAPGRYELRERHTNRRMRTRCPRAWKRRSRRSRPCRKCTTKRSPCSSGPRAISRSGTETSAPEGSS